MTVFRIMAMEIRFFRRSLRSLCADVTRRHQTPRGGRVFASKYGKAGSASPARAGIVVLRPSEPNSPQPYHLPHSRHIIVLYFLVRAKGLSMAPLAGGTSGRG